MFQAWAVKMAKIAAHSAPSWLPGNSPMKNTTVKVRKPSTGTDCRMSSAGMMTSAGLAALGGERGDHEGEQQRGEDRREHPHRGAQRIFGQVARIERDRRDVQARQRRLHLVGAVRHRDDEPEQEDEDHPVVRIRNEAARPKAERRPGRDFRDRRTHGTGLMWYPLGSQHDRPRDDHGERGQAPATAGEDMLLELILSLLMFTAVAIGRGIRPMSRAAMRPTG